MSVQNEPPHSSTPSSASTSTDCGGDVLKAEKASWYREMLEVEPNSKIFLPYARHLAGMDKEKQAIQVLKSGLEKHPEYTEARLYLINLLHQTGDDSQCGAEVARLAGLFCRYPDFWDAWSEFVAQEGDKQDFSVSLGLLGALIRNDSISLLDVLASGLRTLAGSPPPPAGQAAPAGQTVLDRPDPASAASPSADAEERHSESAPAPETTLAAEEPAPATPASTSDEIAAPAVDVAESAALTVEEPEEAGVPEQDETSLHETPPFVFGEDGAFVEDGTSTPVDSHSLDAAEEASAQEKCSLKTRSMAEVLAEQGDIRGAVDIYEELLASAHSGDAADLEARLSSLRGKLAGPEGVAPVRIASASSTPKNVTSQPQAGSQSGVLDLLEKLAVRLESKARQ